MPQLFDVLFNDLRGSKRNVNRLMGAGIVFVLLCHVYVVEPYFRFKAQEKKAQETLRTVEDKREALWNQLQKTKQVSQSVRDALSRIQEEIAGYPDHLRKTLREIHEAVST